MLTLSGYTLGFFFPKQAMHLAEDPAETPPEKKAEPKRLDLTEVRPDTDPEHAEVPASFYFYRYF